MKAFIWGSVILLLLSACSQDSVLEGISQNSSHDSKLEKARINLDSSNYDQVISDLSPLYTSEALDSKVAQLLASAYMGKAGIDPTILIAHSTSSGLKPFDVVASMISSSNVTIIDGGKYIASSLMPDILGYITNAEEPLQLMVKKGKANPDDIIQLGIASATHFIMFLGNATKYVDMPINTAAYKASALSAKASILPNIGPNNFIVITTSGGIPSYQKDLININNAVIAFSKAFPKPNEKNKIRDRLNDFLDDFLSSALGTTSGVTITDELIMKCSSEGLYNYAQSLAQ
jgi:hypothetical protein